MLSRWSSVSQSGMCYRIYPLADCGHTVRRVTGRSTIQRVVERKMTSMRNLGVQPPVVGAKRRCLVLTADTRRPDEPRNASRPGCPAGAIPFLSGNFWTNAVAAHRMGCDYRFVWCSSPLSTASGQWLRPHWCKAAALHQFLTNQTWAHLREVLLFDADVRLGRVLGSWDRILAVLDRTPLHTLSGAPHNSTLVVQQEMSLGDAVVITSPGYACGRMGKRAAASGVVNFHCTCMMLWRVGPLARQLAWQWMHAPSAHEYDDDQEGFNDVAWRVGDGRIVAVPSRTLFADSNHGDDHRRPEVVRAASEATNQEHRRCTALADGNDARLREALPLHAEDYVARHREKGCLPFNAHRLYEMLPEAEGSALIESLDYTQVLPGHHGSYPNILRSVCFLVLVCVGTQFVPSVATRVVAKIYRPFFS